MVNHPSIPGISAQILIGKDPTIEYLTNNPSGPQTYQCPNQRTAYIPSITGETFSIKLFVGAPFGTPKMCCSKLGFHISVDGHEVWKATCGRPWFKTHQKWHEEIFGVKTGKGRGCRLREFMFSDIEIEDTPHKKETKKELDALKKLGLIEIKIYRENYGRHGGPTPGNPDEFQDEEETIKASERALKGDSKSHGTALRDEMRVSRGNVWRTTMIDGEDSPLLVFRFLYRSEKALKDLHVIERTPSPPPARLPTPELEPEELIDGLTVAQHAELERLKASFESQNKNPKSKEEAVRVKKERSGEEKRKGRAAKRLRDLRGERIEIDLTGEGNDEDNDEDDDDDDDE